MKFIPVVTAAAFAAFTLPALAEPDCSGMAVKVTLDDVVQTFQEAGGEVANAKTNGGKCFEIYGRQDGKRVEIYFSPTTGAEIGRQES